MEPTTAAAAAVAAVVAVAAVLVRRVPDGRRGVVLRRGRPVRRRGGGLLLVLPGLERVVLVPMRPQALVPVCARARTVDGVDLATTWSVLWRVRDERLAARAGEDLRSLVADALERGVRHAVATHALGELTGTTHDELAATVRDRANALLARIGAEVLDVDLLEAEVRVGPELLGRDR